MIRIWSQPETADSLSLNLVALRTLFNALRDAEDHPERHFHVVLTLDNETLAKTEVLSEQIRKDPGIREGDNLCILTADVVDEAYRFRCGGTRSRCLAGWRGGAGNHSDLARGQFCSVTVRRCPRRVAVAVSGAGACWLTAKGAGALAGGDWLGLQPNTFAR